MPPDTANGDRSSRPTARYIVITPARNEESSIAATISSMRRQSLAPIAWHIVDDGSTDETATIVEQAASETPWIHLVRRSDRGYRQAGAGVVQAFESGYEMVKDTRWDFLVKLDADLRFDDEYFASCIDAFEKDETLGIAGGMIYNVVNGERVAEPHPSFHVRGATKIYRSACWEDIGGLVSASGWDTIDELSANMHGWTTRTLPDIPVDQLRVTGGAAGQWSNWVKNGRAAYLSGYHPLFLIARAMRRLTIRPYIAGPAGLLWGYSRSAIKREPLAVDPELASYVRTQQMNRLTRRTSIWH